MDTPQRCPSPSAAGSPQATRDDGVQEAILTPRSKIRAMMARIDDSDDDEQPAIPVAPALRSGSLLAAIEKAPTLASDDEDEDLPMPRGRLAGRMRAAKASSDTDDEQSSAPDGAYERLKRELHAQAQIQEEDDQQAASANSNERRPSIGLGRSIFTKKRAGVSASRLQTSGLVTTESPRPSSAASSTPPTPESGHPSDHSEFEMDDDSRARVTALAAKKAAEREAREAEEEAKRIKRRERLQQSSDRLEEIIDEDMDADAEDARGSKKLGSQARPTRKASKKAIEEMSRETQRMSRNMQLAHAATTRKKITKESLFARFNFKLHDADPVATVPEPASSSAPGTSRPCSDAEREHQTPPSSPLSLTGSPPGNGNKDALEQIAGSDVSSETSIAPRSPAHKDIVAPVSLGNSFMKLSAKAQGKQREYPLVPLSTDKALAPAKQRRPRVQNFRLKLPEIHADNSSDSDLDLEIAPAKPLTRKLNAFLAGAPKSRVSSREPAAPARQAPMTKNSNRPGKAPISVGQMHLNLLRKARQQIALDKAEKLDELRAKGVIIQTAEEIERDQMVTENMIEKARREAHDLAKTEKEERKKEKGGDKGDAMDLDDSDEESYVFSGDDEDETDVDNEDGEEELDAHDGDEEELELSGSEDEEEVDDGGVQLDNKQPSLFDNEAAENSESEEADAEEEEAVNQEAEDEGAEPIQQPGITRRSCIKRIIDDDDDDNDEAETAVLPFPKSTATAQDVVNPFGNAANPTALGAAPMGLTQAFAATMDSQVDEDESDTESSALVAPMPEPNVPIVDQAALLRKQALPGVSSLDFLIPSLPAIQYNTQRTVLSQDFEMPEPTQDEGLAELSPIAQRFASIPPSTTETLLVSNPQAAEVVNPNLKKRGRLMRRDQIDRASDLETTGLSAENAPAESPAKSVDAFIAMRKAERHRQRLEEYSKKKSAAKDIVDEQAEESEDEYAGLGGASDDESGGEMDEEVKKMLDDETNLDMNESQLAALHAETTRAQDEKDVAKLYKDINSGMLRRKRGTGGFDDLSDSDDEAERRVRKKQAEFARMRRAMLADENVGKIAENPKKAAFMRALEDRDDGYSMDFGAFDDAEPNPGLVREDSLQEVPNSQPERPGSAHRTQIGPEKRKRALEQIDPNNRLPPHLRRTKPELDGYRKPANLAEVRENLSFLLQDSHDSEVLVPATQTDDEPEPEPELDGQSIEARLAANRVKKPWIDRAAVKRAESMKVNTSGRNMAFLPKGYDDQGTRIPSLLRRATTQSASEVTFGTERTIRKEVKVKMGGTKKSSVMYWARETERQKAVNKVEKRRDDERKKAIAGRRGLLKGLSTGSFE